MLPNAIETKKWQFDLASKVHTRTYSHSRTTLRFDISVIVFDTTTGGRRKEKSTFLGFQKHRMGRMNGIIKLFALAFDVISIFGTLISIGVTGEWRK